jgi:hypothetical protein
MTPRDPNLLDDPGVRAQTHLLFDRKGRLILPDDDDYLTSYGAPAFAETDLDVIDAEVIRRRRRWRFRLCAGLTLFVLFVGWTFVVMPLAALHLRPFK